MNGVNAAITYQNGRLMVSGDLNFKTVMDLWNQSLLLVKQCPILIFDLSNVIASNSAGLALLLEWVKYATLNNKKITFEYLPLQLNSIISVAGITELLNLVK